VDAYIWEDSGVTRQRMNMGGEKSEEAYDGNAALELLRAALHLLVAGE